MRTVTAILVSVTLLCSVSFSQTKRKPAPAKSKTSSPAKPSGSLFSPHLVNTNIEVLPVDYLGNDFTKLYEELDSRSRKLSKKDEFETTEAFEKRKLDLQNATIVGEITENSLLAISPPDISSIYDADQGILQVRAKIENAETIYEPRNYKDALSLVTVRRSSDTYIGQNGFGAKVEVDKTYYDHYSLILANVSEIHLRPLNENKFSTGELVTPSNRIEEIERRFQQKGLVFDLKIPAEEAKALKPTVALLVLCRLSSPAPSEGIFHSKPTVSAPSEFYISSHYLTVKLTEAWVYDKATGRIYTKVKIGQGPQ